MLGMNLISAGRNLRVFFPRQTAEQQTLALHKAVLDHVDLQIASLVHIKLELEHYIANSQEKRQNRQST